MPSRSIASLACFVGATRRSITLRIIVPAVLPVMPAFAMTAAIVNSSCVLSPNSALALSAVNVSPMPSTVVALALADLTHWSIIVPMSPNSVWVVFMIGTRYSIASARSRPPACARSIACGMPWTISSNVHPACAASSMAAATSFVWNMVVLAHTRAYWSSCRMSRLNSVMLSY